MPYVILAALLICAAGCGGDSPAGLTGGGPDAIAVVVSNPVSSGAGAPAGVASLTESELAYVSLPPGTVATGRSATIRNQRSGAVASTAVSDGGFDPVAVPAQEGDTLRLTVQFLTGSDEAEAIVVVPKRKRPVVVRTDPPPKKRDVALNASIVIVFSEPIDPATINPGSITLELSGGAVSGTVGLVPGNPLVAEFNPAAWLEPGSSYELVVTQEIRDLDGEALAASIQSTFTTAALPPSVTHVELAFVRDGRIYGVAADGTGLVRLSEGPHDVDPTWSPDGKRIAFARGTTQDRVGNYLDHDIWVMDADGSNLVQATTQGREPAWSPDGRKLVHTRRGVATWSDLYVVSVDEDGAGATAVTQAPQSELQPAWSPDGSRIAFMSDRIDPELTRDIFLTSVDGSKVTQLTDGYNDGGPDLIEYYHPTWSPDGSTLAVVACPMAAPTCIEGYVAKMNPDGTGFRILTALRGTIRTAMNFSFGKPTWSPDGQRIAFTSLESIHWVSADGSAQGLIVSNGRSPAWRP